jgi:hypothetical protein
MKEITLEEANKKPHTYMKCRGVMWSGTIIKLNKLTVRFQGQECDDNEGFIKNVRWTSFNEKRENVLFYDL